MKKVLEQLNPYRESLEKCMVPLLTAPSTNLQPLYGMMNYHIGWADEAFRPTNAQTGKRLRPILCLLICEAVSGDFTRALPVAVAVEMLHNFSLLHDDIEDGDTERHNRPTVWSLWGVAQGINTGDAMFALSRLALHTLFSMEDIPVARSLTVIRRFDKTAVVLCQGQYLDMTFEAQADVDMDNYLQMIGGKTAALLAFAAESGAQLGEGDEDTVAAYHRFGEAMGMAFQMIDDALGIWGDTRLTGKPVGADVRRRKKSLPVVHAMTTLSGKDREELLRFYATEEPVSDRDVSRITWLLEQAGGRSIVRHLANEWQRRAMESLEQANPTGSAGDLLHELAVALLRRQY